MDISVRKTTTTGLSDKSWIHAGRDGSLQNMLSETLDLDLFDETTQYPDGSIRSGTVLARVTVGGLLGPYDDSDTTTGLGTAVGFLYEDTPVNAGSTRAGCAVYHTGGVVVANLPTNNGLDAAARADLTHCYFRD